LARRLGTLEASVRQDAERRWAAAVETLKETLAPEHARLIADWLRGPDAVDRGGQHGHGRDRVCSRCILDGDPPALVRAALLMLIDSTMTSGAPVALPPDVAAVYLEAADAYPANACEGCGYLMPMRATIRPDGTYRHIATYRGSCPVCGLGNRPREGDDHDHTPGSPFGAPRRDTAATDPRARPAAL
jgi:hypothetical protein